MIDPTQTCPGCCQYVPACVCAPVNFDRVTPQPDGSFLHSLRGRPVPPPERRAVPTLYDVAEQAIAEQAQRDAMLHGFGAYRRHPDGRPEYLPPEQLVPHRRPAANAVTTSGALVALADLEALAGREGHKLAAVVRAELLQDPAQPHVQAAMATLDYRTRLALAMLFSVERAATFRDGVAAARVLLVHDRTIVEGDRQADLLEALRQVLAHIEPDAAAKLVASLPASVRELMP